jgi:hypothetical protein
VNPLFQFWYFHLPNYVLAAIMYSLLGRLILSFFFPPQSDNYIWKAFIAVTQPAVRAVGFVTPKAVPLPVLIIFAFIWILVIRFAFLTSLMGAGLAPRAG